MVRWTQRVSGMLPCPLWTVAVALTRTRMRVEVVQFLDTPGRVAPEFWQNIHRLFHIHLGWFSIFFAVTLSKKFVAWFPTYKIWIYLQQESQAFHAKVWTRWHIFNPPDERWVFNKGDPPARITLGIQIFNGKLEARTGTMDKRSCESCYFRPTRWILRHVKKPVRPSITITRPVLVVLNYNQSSLVA